MVDISLMFTLERHGSQTSSMDKCHKGIKTSGLAIGTRQNDHRIISDFSMRDNVPSDTISEQKHPYHDL